MVQTWVALAHTGEGHGPVSSATASAARARQEDDALYPTSRAAQKREDAREAARAAGKGQEMRDVHQGPITKETYEQDRLDLIAHVRSKVAQQQAELDIDDPIRPDQLEPLILNLAAEGQTSRAAVVRRCQQTIQSLQAQLAGKE